MSGSDFMNWTAAIALLSILCQTAATGFHIWLDWKKSREPPKDEIWETAVRIFTASEEPSRLELDTEEFARLYANLSYIHSKRETLHKSNSLERPDTEQEPPESGKLQG